MCAPRQEASASRALCRIQLSALELLGKAADHKISLGISLGAMGMLSSLLITPYCYTWYLLLY